MRSDVRLGGAVRHRVIGSPLGPLTLAVDDTGALTGVFMAEPDRSADATLGVRDDTVAPDAAAQLAEYFAGTRTTFDLRLAAAGTEFQRRVWAVLREIPYGETWTYGRVAARLGNPHASRAVGRAAGRNPLGIVVPCHRVIGSDGALVGYAGGVDRKRWLLDHEARVRMARP